jgi:hypothetical protein
VSDDGIDLDAIKARHAAYRARLVVERDDRLVVDDVPVCTKCGISWPCDAAALVIFIESAKAR